MRLIFGYVICNKEGLNEEELQRYQAMYCGVCRSLKERYGWLERFSLNYDMTFVALFLTALYEPQESEVEFRCPLHPLHDKKAVQNKYTDYAADMTIALAYHKCRDDWMDEHKRISLKYSELLEGKYAEVQKRYPRQCMRMEHSLKSLREVENCGSSTPDEAVNCSGRMLSEVFVYEEDFWCNTLRAFGYELGRFIYLMDAAMDYERDRKKKNYNPLFGMHLKPDEVEEILTMAIGNATHQFEMLPILEDEKLLRNILYGGVWQKYYAKIKGRKENPNGI